MKSKRSDALTETKTIDATGLFCPGPIKILKGVAKKLEKGTIIRLLADDTDVLQEIEEWCAETENTLISTEDAGDIQTYTVKIG